MRRLLSRIRAHTLSPGGRPALRLELESDDIPAAGQPLLAFLPGSTAPLRTPIFPSQIHSDGFTSTELPTTDWTVGTYLDLLGPIGSGFSPPPQSKRWVLIALGRSMDRLLPLVDEAIDRDLAIAVYSDNPVPVLPPQVEIGASLEDLIEWSDYIALDLHDPRSVSLPGFLGNAIQPAARIELLTDLALPCGLGVCGACAVASRHGWKLACQDGPVFKWKDWNR